MAARWRIRHKLMLGLGLVVVILALLLCGTSRGLWSYYLTTNTIRGKIAELAAAQELKAAVAELVAPDNAAGLVRAPDRLPGEVKKVRDKLDAYQERLEDTVGHGRDPGQGVYERELIDKLHADLDGFERAVGGRAGDARVVGVSDDDLKRQDLDKLAKPIDTLKRDALDLCDHLNDELAGRLGETRRHYQVALWIIVPSSVLGLALLAGLVRSFYAWVFYPIRDLEAGVGRLAQGDFAHRIELNSGDEMEDLAIAFNAMTRQLHEVYSDLARQVNERSRQLVRSERLASVGFLAAGVAHEINNPLASIAFCSEALEARLADLTRPGGRAGDEHELFAKYLRMIQQEAFRCKNITERLLAFSRPGEKKRELTDLVTLVEAVLDVTRHLQNHKGKHIDVEVGADRPGGRVAAWVNAEEVKSVVLNLVVNALDSMDEGGRLRVRVGQRDGLAVLQFTDTGCGMSAEVLENVFEPFFTRSRGGKGTGLGLTISHQIVQQHGGDIEATSAGPGRGSTFTVRLPLRPDDAEARDEGRPAAHRAAA